AGDKKLTPGVPGLSTITLYVTDLETQLIRSGLGFSLAHLEDGLTVEWVLFGLTYADSVVLTAASVCDAQNLLDICTEIATGLGLKFNANKSAAVLFAAAIRGTDILRRRNLWSCNRFVLTRELWKAVVVPGLTFANAVVCVPGDIRAHIERRQRETRWQKRLYQLESEYGFLADPVQASSATEWERGVRKNVRDQETQQWLKDAQSKTTLDVYVAQKRTIGSTLPYRRHFGSTVTTRVCRVCGAHDDTVAHIVLECAELRPTRSRDNNQDLQSPLELAEVLGFTVSRDEHQTIEVRSAALADSPASNETTASSGPHRPSVEATKRRLEDWWKKIYLRGQ
ncbi:hypothetical protein HPB47_016612, partial [Ixodes persulcatus]